LGIERRTPLDDIPGHFASRDLIGLRRAASRRYALECDAADVVRTLP